MKIVLAVVCAAFLSVGYAQIKTHRPQSGSLIHNSSTVLQPGAQPYPYQPGVQPYPHQPGVNPHSENPFGPQHFGPPEQPYVDPLTQFINKTRSEMPSGFCQREVPTATLVQGSDVIPAGNGSNPSLSKIQVCCDGYERNVHNFKQCDPICKNDCVNGMCVAPNQCVCFPDSVRNLAGYCIPTCPIGCGNGDCQPDGQCVCKPGYIIDPTTRKFCIPQCEHGCGISGNCTAPNVCACSDGYETKNNICVPKCDNCEFGTCEAPGQCKCNAGYQKTPTGCIPVCNGCADGICVAPNKCQCRPGFALDASGLNCEAHCERPCLNGRCIGPNICGCNSGYVLDEFDTHICKASCDGGCPNGQCIGVNMCVCNPGYVKQRGVKGRAQCIPAN